MTGWRVGQLVVPAGTPSPLGRLQQALLSCSATQRVAVAPGTVFGPAGGGWVRLSLAAETEGLLEGARRLAGFTLS